MQKGTIIIIDVISDFLILFLNYTIYILVEVSRIVFTITIIVTVKATGKNQIILDYFYIPPKRQIFPDPESTLNFLWL